MVPNDFLERFDELARHTGQPREDVMIQALEAYLARIAEEDARLETARAAVARGEWVDADEADAQMEAWLLTRGITPEQLATRVPCSGQGLVLDGEHLAAALHAHRA
jgi:predicted transcriptional regulator